VGNDCYPSSMEWKGAGARKDFVGLPTATKVAQGGEPSTCAGSRAKKEGSVKKNDSVRVELTGGICL
jgi:hypothetical protein